MASNNLSENFHLEQKLWTKENGFHWQKIRFHFSTSRKISCALAIMRSFSQNCFLFFFLIMVSASSEIALTKKILFPIGRKSICANRVKDIEKYVSTIRKSCFHFKKSVKKMKKLVSTSRNGLVFYYFCVGQKIW